tara:strand:+ start:416 stop:670 length:255 start_codon:yes stop_codon:yes gene_type:complete
MSASATIQKELEIIKKDCDNCWTYYLDTVKLCSLDETNYTTPQKQLMIEDSKSYMLNSLAQYNKIRIYHDNVKTADILLDLQSL